MIHVSFLVMNLEQLLTLGMFSWRSLGWQGRMNMWNSLLVAWWLQMNTGCSERSSDGLAASVERIPQLAA
jgi:hypothetical protein